MLESRNGPVHSKLNVLRHGAGHSVDVHLICILPLRLDKYLVARLVRETNNLVLNGRAVARTGCVNHAAVERGAIDIVANNFMCLLICVGEPTGFLFNLHRGRICGK